MLFHHGFSAAFQAGALALAAAACVLHAADPAPAFKPVPRMQVIPLPAFQASFQFEGHELTKYIYDPQAKRPFWYPVKTTLAPSLVRMGHPHDTAHHLHHYGLWMGYMKVSGVDFWEDEADDVKMRPTGTIRHQRIIGFWDGDESAAMRTVNHWVTDRDNQVLLIERRHMAVMPMPDATSWLLIVDSEFTVPQGQITTFTPSGFGLMAARMAKAIGVDDGGGRMLNSEGRINEKEIFRQPARWCDFSGRLTNEAKGLAGLALFHHPDNPNQPANFHVRDNGCMFASTSLLEAMVVTDAQPLRIRCGVWVHEGVAPAEQCEAMWKRFVALPKPDPNLKP